MNLFELDAESIEGQRTPMADFRGNVLLIVNTASACGFTPQYAGLQALYDRYRDKGFAVLGFPCNQFGSQEPGDETEIQTFCTARFGVSFPMFAKIDVNGQNVHPIYAHLKKEARGILGSTAIKWNFTKFLVGRNGEVLGRYAPQTEPAELAQDIERALNETPANH